VPGGLSSAEGVVRAQSQLWQSDCLGPVREQSQVRPFEQVHWSPVQPECRGLARAHSPPRLQQQPPQDCQLQRELQQPQQQHLQEEEQQLSVAASRVDPCIDEGAEEPSSNTAAPSPALPARRPTCTPRSMSQLGLVPVPCEVVGTPQMCAREPAQPPQHPPASEPEQSEVAPRISSGTWQEDFMNMWFSDTGSLEAPEPDSAPAPTAIIKATAGLPGADAVAGEERPLTPRMSRWWPQATAASGDWTDKELLGKWSCNAKAADGFCDQMPESENIIPLLLWKPEEDRDSAEEPEPECLESRLELLSTPHALRREHRSPKVAAHDLVTFSQIN